MSALMTVQAIVLRDLSRAVRQKSRLLGGLARPFMWLLLVGTGYNTIVYVEGARSYHHNAAYRRHCARRGVRP